MGNLFGCCAPRLYSAEADTALSDAEDVFDKEGEVHMLVCGIDYSCDTQSWAGKKPLDTRHGFDMMVHLAQACQVDTLKTLWNTQCTKAGVKQAIEEVASKCGPDDYFVVYYTGHGDQLAQDDIEEDEAKDQCLCLVDEYGNTDDATMTYRQQVWLRDDDFASAILDSLSEEAKVLVLIDACHSGSICDFHPESEWARRGYHAISISGCEDHETSAGTGRGGHFSRSLTKAVQSISQCLLISRVSGVHRAVDGRLDQIDDGPQERSIIVRHVLGGISSLSENPIHNANSFLQGSLALLRARNLRKDISDRGDPLAHPCAA